MAKRNRSIAKRKNSTEEVPDPKITKTNEAAANKTRSKSVEIAAENINNGSGLMETQGNQTKDLDFEHVLANQHTILGLDSQDLSLFHMYCIDRAADGEGKLDRSLISAMKLIASTYLLISKGKDETIKELKETVIKPKSSYASAVKAQPTSTQTTNESPQDTIIVKVSKPDQIYMVKNQVRELINKSSGNHKVDQIWNTKNVIVIKKPKSASSSALEKEINEFTTTNSLGNAYIPAPKRPTIVIKDVLRCTDLNKIPEMAALKNNELKGLEKEFDFLFQMKPKNSQVDSIDVVYRVSPEVYTVIMNNMNGRLYFGSQGCTVQKRVFVRQCQHCFEFNHSTNNCKNNIHLCKSCGKEKAQGHKCPDTPCCINCSKSPKHKHSTDHFPNFAVCPLYAQQIKRTEDETQYTTSMSPQ